MAQVKVGRIETARIYLQGVELSRQIDVEVPSTGTQTVDIILNQKTIKEDSLNILCENDNFVLHQIKIKRHPTTLEGLQQKYPQLEALLNELESVKKNWAKTDEEIKLAKNRHALLLQYLEIPESPTRDKSVRDFANLITPGNLTKVEKMLEAEEQNIVSLTEKTVASKLQIEITIHKIEQLTNFRFFFPLNLGRNCVGREQVLSKLTSSYQDSRTTIHMTGQFKTPTVALTLRYNCFDARWNPSYEVSLSSEDETTLTLKYYAAIRQGTGEMWENVRLLITSLHPDAPVAPPPLNRRGATLAQFGTTPPSNGIPHEYKNVFPHAAETQAQTLFEVFHKQTVANNAKKRILLGSATLPISLEYVAIPEAADTVFRTTELTNSTDMSLLQSSSVSILHDGNYIAKTNIPKVIAPNEKFRIYLGQDQKLQINSKPASKISKQTGNVVTGQFLKDTYKRDFVVKNNYSKPMTLMIIVSMPDSESDQIKVSSNHTAEFKKCPKGFHDDLEAISTLKNTRQTEMWCWNETTGHCIAVCQLDPHTAPIFSHGYSVDYPKSIQTEIVTK
eukprot:Gregarina_sp_Poly_1__8945@NODE_541_length_7591_cov_68_175970_g428_i0_p1_GENE_NODE_541_length_7591_cov_68_175970_g428_i0NODE_541_length_7591_cov_68_175970_g428_i0_p1_ORF_typecomplete_len562_score69_65DUF4139/PF13598_6/7_2e44DUF4140/PF13600_6/0_00021DUF4140/PF13600_6/9_6e03ATPsynt_D/PF01813_17/0_084Med9/PF07544_13/0_57_NODE_541_length_7591_cov_68_175970_g428_i058547539